MGRKSGTDVAAFANFLKDRGILSYQQVNDRTPSSQIIKNAAICFFGSFGRNKCTQLYMTIKRNRNEIMKILKNCYKNRYKFKKLFLRTVELNNINKKIGYKNLTKLQIVTPQLTIGISVNESEENQIVDNSVNPKKSKVNKNEEIDRSKQFESKMLTIASNKNENANFTDPNIKKSRPTKCTIKAKSKKVYEIGIEALTNEENEIKIKKSKDNYHFNKIELKVCDDNVDSASKDYSDLSDYTNKICLENGLYFDLDYYIECATIIKRNFIVGIYKYSNVKISLLSKDYITMLSPYNNVNNVIKFTDGNLWLTDTLV
ncbi:hypothetical protein FQA39_LY08622 [Lamprigera yunnana]|nr:hypothetical protein FQA39_LY08622 [Lamprigera yunnana]